MHLLDIALEAAHSAGRVVRARFGAPGAVTVKGFRDIVTEADLEAQAAAQAVILEQAPGSAILGEESDRVAQAEALRAETVWVIDPIDGTTNFSRGFPAFAVSIGVCRAGAPVVGVVYEPLRGQAFCAERGAGAYVRADDGATQALHVSRVTDMAAALGGVDWARDPALRQRVLDCLGRLAPACRTVRAVGSAALGIVYVAAGWLDVYYHLSLAPWDAAGAVAILREAGGRATDLPLEPGAAAAEWDLTTPRVLATNGVLHAAALELLAG